MPQYGSAEALASALLAHDRACPIYLMPHVRADSDAVGSGLGLLAILKRLGFKVRLLLDEALPKNLSLLRLKSELEVYDPALSYPPGRIFYHDCHGPERLGERAALAEEATLLPFILDHHRSVTKPAAEVAWIDPDCSSSAEMVFQFLQCLVGYGHPLHEMIDQDLAEALLAGIYGDTGSLAYSNVRPSTYECCAALLDYGPRLPEIVESLFNRRDYASFITRAEILARAERLADGRLIVVQVQPEDLARHGSNEEALEGLAAQMRSVEGVELSILGRRLESGEWRLNLRSSALDCRDLAERFGGGGHLRAAGANIKENEWNIFIENAIQAIKALETEQKH